MYRGNHQVCVDKVGRLRLPAAFRSVVDEHHDTSFFITSMDGHSIEIYPMREWMKLEEQLMERSILDPAVKKFLTIHFYFGEIVEMDAQGRLLLPGRLRESAKITDNVVIFGNLTHMCVVNRDQFEHDILAEQTLSPDDQVQLEGVLTKTSSVHN
jgi:MraZ protein